MAYATNKPIMVFDTNHILGETKERHLYLKRISYRWTEKIKLRKGFDAVIYPFLVWRHKFLSNGSEDISGRPNVDRS